MKIYTKTGDGGITSLLDGSRVKKSDERVCICGALDEVSVEMGALLSEGVDKNDRNTITQLQKTLYEIMGVTSGGEIRDGFRERLTDVTKVIEKRIDDLSISLPPLKDFILPQGSDLTTQAHRARVVTRRAERECVVYQNSLNTEIRPHILKLLNRISDYFFVLARSFSTTDSITKLS